jgi:hypothetical protein
LIAITRALAILAFAACQQKSGDPKRVDPPVPTRVVIDAPAPVVFTRNQIAVGSAYGCIRTHGATLSCWGRSFPDAPSPVSVPNAASVVAAQGTTCALTNEGYVYCMDGGPPSIVVGLDDAVQIATDPDAFVTCARRKSGHVACWSDFDKPGAVKDIAGVSGALEIAVAGSTMCMRDTSGVACWHEQDPVLHHIPNTADTTSLAGGHFTFAAIRRGKPPLAWHEDAYGPQLLPALNSDVQQIALGSDTACALGHTVQCWDLASASKPYDIAAAGATEIAVGYALRCARFTDHVACWGSAGTLGDGTPGFSDEPVEVANLTDATQIAIVADQRTCALRANKHVVCWGTTTNTQTDAVPVEDSSNKDLFVARPRSWSGSHQRGSWTCSEKKGHVTCMMTFYGRHDDGVSTDEETTWGNLDGVRDIRMPSNDSDDVCVANALGDVSCFPAFEGADKAVQVDGVSDVIALTEYGESTCAIERRGTVKCWNEREREYTGGVVKTLSHITDAVQIAGSTVHACARLESGKVDCWGDRSLLGDNSDTHQVVPKVVAGIRL